MLFEWDCQCLIGWASGDVSLFWASDWSVNTGVFKERRNVRGIMSERKGGQLCELQTGPIKTDQSTC